MSESPWDDVLTRLIELLGTDPPLHDAVVRAIDAHAHAEDARADHEHALAERARASSKGHSASDEVAVEPDLGA